MKSAFEQMKQTDRNAALQPSPLPREEEEAVPDAIEIARDLEDYFAQRRETLKDIPYPVVRAAWFSLSHLLVEDGAKIAVMGCGEGTHAFCMAALAPGLRFIGIDKSKRKLNKAREKYELHNLEFIQADVTEDMTAVISAQSLDGIINNFFLHMIFSNARYNEQIVTRTLENQFKLLKPGGMMFIQDYPRLLPEEFVLIEFPDEPSRGEALADMSEPDLLVWYSRHARVRQDPTRGGFFIEELPPRRPRTRLFRLPFKWAYEFIIRKGRRERWETELPVEYTFFTIREFHKNLRALGARVQYSAPLWDEDYIEENFDGKLRLFDPDGRPLETPPTSFIAVACKMPERKSLLIEERRPSNDGGPQHLKITAMRNERNGKLVDIVTPEEMVSEVIPYRISSRGRLKIYLHDGIARGITNAVTRSGNNLDGKRWSGHMVEAIAVDAAALEDYKNFSFKDTVRFARDYLGLKPASDASVLQGPDYYPSPDFIDEHIYTYYLNVQKNGGPSQPKKILNSLTHFQSKGEVREFDAQQVLNAIAVGMIPNARLELQILALFSALKLRAENWTAKDVTVGISEANSAFDQRDFMKALSMQDHRFREVKGTTGELRAVKSIFVEEGQTAGSKVGIHSHDLDFVVSEEKTVNTAVVLPLTGNVKKDMHAGFLLEHLPVPQRYAGNGLTVTVPSFNIPPEIRDIKQIKKFVADKFGVTPDMVFKLGESYYTHIGLTPQRIYPFGVAAPPAYIKDPDSHFIPIQQFRALWKATAKSVHFMTVLARGFKMLDSHFQYQYTRDVQNIRSARILAAQDPDWSIPIFEPPPGKRASDKSEPQPKTAKPAAKPEKNAKARAREPVSLMKKSAARTALTGPLPKGAFHTKRAAAAKASDSDPKPHLER